MEITPVPSKTARGWRHWSPSPRKETPNVVGFAETTAGTAERLKPLGTPGAGFRQSARPEPPLRPGGRRPKA